MAARERQGIVYVCTRCSTCCRWPGEVRLSRVEQARIASCLQLRTQDFLDRYTTLRRDRQGLTLIERPDGACIMLDEPNRCRIQAAKPQQCTLFPNRWNFPGFHEQCQAIALHYTLRPVGRRAGPVAYGREPA